MTVQARTDSQAFLGAGTELTNEPADGQRRFASPWRRLVRLKIMEIRAQPLDPAADAASEAHIAALLQQAEELLHISGSFRSWWTGAQCDHAWRLVHEAEAQAVTVLPDKTRLARTREVFFDARTILDEQDPILAHQPEDPEGAAELIRRYRAAWDDRYTRSRNYRNRLIVLTGVVTVFAAALVGVGALGLFPITSIQRQSNGTLRLEWPSWNPGVQHLLAMVAIGTLGAVGGVLAGARQVTQMGGVYNPFYLPLHSLFLKIQMGALCGLAGVLAILGGLAPEITLTQWGDIAVWALVFGAAQQLVTQLVDRKVTALITSEPRKQEIQK